MNGGPELPRFYFRVDELRENTRTPRGHPETGEWVPPREYRANSTAFNQILQQGTAFFFNGRSTQPNPGPLPGYLFNILPLAYSIYCGEAGKLWTVPYDASRTQVHDGRDDGISVQLPRNAQPDWRELHFDPSNTDRRDRQRVSFANYQGTRRQLLLWRANQDWVEQIIPARYRSQQPNAERSRNDAPTGGLNGDIALLIGLIALSIPLALPPQHPQDNMLRYLPLCVQSNFRALPLRAGLHGDDARRAKRGVLVQVWIDMPRPLTPQEQRSAEMRDLHDRMKVESRANFRAFETGRFGPIFP